MKLRNQILALGLVGVLMAGVVGAIGLLNANRLVTDLETSNTSATALQSSQSADMMHDAIRGDVLLALLGATTGKTAQVAEAQKALQEHSAIFTKNMDLLLSLPVSAEVKAVAAKTTPVIANYKETATKVVTLANTNAGAAQAAIPDFQRAFTELEDLMGQQSSAIEKDAQANVERTQNAASRTLTQIMIGMVLGTVVLMFASLWLAKQLAQPMAHAMEVADQLAQGDLSSHITPAGNDETQRLLDAMARMQTSFGGIVRSVKINAESVATASAEIASGNNDLSNRTEQQASALEKTASAMEELSATVKQNADSARQANQLAMSASTVAVKGGEVVGQVVETMKGINDSSRKISDIISVIDGIAFQTNILALNAAVEAARAGEQGRGFAVVASEVRSLAGRSADAAKEIKTLISASVERVEHGTSLVDQAGVTMTEVVGSIKRVTDIMGEISAASNEQAQGVSEVGAAVSQMDQTTQQNAALVEEMAAAATSLKSQAQELVQVVAVFKLNAAEHQGQGLPKAAVRSNTPKNPPYKGPERRTDGARASSGPAARAKPAAASPARAPAPAPAAKPAPAKAAAPQTVTPKISTKNTPAGGDDDWETF